jgi:hypothetical protein
MATFDAQGRKPIAVPEAEALSNSAVVNNGWFGYAYGVSGEASMIIDEGPNSLVGAALQSFEYLDAPERFNPYQEFAPRENLPPLIADGSAQRAHPNILALAEFTPIGPGEIWLRDIHACQGADQMFDIETWQSGIGQIANQVALVYGAGSNTGSGVVLGAGVTQLPYLLPSDLSNAATPSDAPNAGGVPY